MHFLTAKSADRQLGMSVERATNCRSPDRPPLDSETAECSGLVNLHESSEMSYIDNFSDISDDEFLEATQLIEHNYLPLSKNDN